jgi:hypothetical protein
MKVAAVEDSPFHDFAFRRLSEPAQDTATWAILWPCLHEFLARIAALCRQHGVRELWSADRDFNRFPGLVVVNPLVEGR